MEIKTHWLIFSNNKNRLSFATKKGFHHVGVVGNNGKHWYALEPLYKRMNFKIWNRPITDDVPKILKKMGFKVIKIQVKNDLEKGFKLNLVMFLVNCTTYVQYIVGLPCLSLTPYGLYKRVLRGKMKNLVSAQLI